MRQLLAVLALALLGSVVQAQSNVPGYLGKRHSISVQYHSGMGLFGGEESLSYRKGLQGWGAGEIYFTHSVGGAFNRVLTKRFSIGLGVRKGWLGMRSTSIFSPFERLKTTAAGVHLDIFPFRRKGTIAPIGPFTKFKFYWAYNQSFAVDRVSGTEVPPTGEVNGRMMMPFIFMEFGNNFVISDLLTLSPGLSFGGGLPAFVPLDATTSDQSIDMWLRLQSGWGVNLFVEMSILL